MNFGKTLQFFRIGEKHEIFNLNHNEHFVCEAECLAKCLIKRISLNSSLGDFIDFRLKCLNFRKFKNCKICYMEMSRTSFVLEICNRYLKF